MTTTPPTPPRAVMLPGFNVPMAYFNGFNAGLSGGEISAFLTHDNQPALKVVMSLSTAKSLAVALSELVEKYETATQTKVFSTEELASLLSDTR